MRFKRRQYGIRSLFVLLTVMGCLLGWVAWQQRLARKRMETLEAALQASRLFDERLRTAVGNGAFTQYEQGPNDKELTLRTEGRLWAFYDGGNYHIRANFEKRLRPYRTNRIGANSQPSSQRFMDDKPDVVFIVHDGAETVMVEESKQKFPNGYRWNLNSSVNSAAKRQGIPWGDVMRLGRQLTDLDQLVENLTPQNIELADLSGGGIQLRYNAENSPQVRVEIDIPPTSGYHATSRRVYNPGQQAPNTEMTAEWRQADGVWYVHRLARRRHYPNGTIIDQHFEFDQFTVNPDIEPWLFTIDSIEYQDRSLKAFAQYLADGREKGVKKGISPIN